MIIEVGGAEWRRIEDYMKEHRDCIDTLNLYDVIVFYVRIYRRHDPFTTDDLTGETMVDRAIAISAAQMYCDIPDDF